MVEYNAVLMGLLCTLSLGLIGRVIYVWLASDKTPRSGDGKYVTTKELNDKMVACPQANALRQEFIEQKTFVKTKLKHHDSLLQETNQDVKQMSGVLSEVHTEIALLTQAVKQLTKD